MYAMHIQRQKQTQDTRVRKPQRNRQVKGTWVTNSWIYNRFSWKDAATLFLFYLTAWATKYEMGGWVRLIRNGEGCGMKQPWSIFRYYPRSFMERIRKTTSTEAFLTKNQTRDFPDMEQEYLPLTSSASCHVRLDIFSTFIPVVI